LIDKRTKICTLDVCITFPIIFQADENDLENDDITLLPARLEYYDSEKKWREGAHPKKRIVLTDCFDINRKKETANQYVIAVYTLNEGLDILFENDQVSLVEKAVIGS